MQIITTAAHADTANYLAALAFAEIGRAHV